MIHAEAVVLPKSAVLLFVASGEAELSVGHAADEEEARRVLASLGNENAQAIERFEKDETAPEPKYAESALYFYTLPNGCTFGLVGTDETEQSWVQLY